MTLTQVWQLWNQFWFERRSPLPMAVFRIFYGLHVLAFVLLLSPDFSTWYGTDGMISVDTNMQWLQQQRFSIFNWVPPTTVNMMAAFILLAIAACTVTLGLFTRTSLLIVVVLLFSIHHRNLVILNSGDLFMRLSGVYLLLSHAGGALSLDNVLKRRAGLPVETLYPIWAQRLVQLQIATVYLHSFLGKINGVSWLDGTAIYYVARLQDFQKLPVPLLFDNIWTIKLLTWSTLVIEFALCTLVWVKEFRYYVLAGGVLLHLGIEWTMNIPLFETQMIAAYVVFVDAADLERVLEKIRSHFRRSGSAVQSQVELSC